MAIPAPPIRPPAIPAPSGLPVSTSLAVGVAVDRARFPPRPYRPPVPPQVQQPELRPIGGTSAIFAEAEKMEIHVIDSDMDDGLMDDARWLQAQFNPNELLETVKVNWARLKVQGQSHQRQHYESTESVPFRFELFFDAFAHQSIRDGIGYIETARDFLRSLAFPTEKTGAPPRCLFYWPEFISLTAVLDSVAIKYTQFDRTGVPLKLLATVDLTEIRDVRLTRAEAFRQGNRRSAPPAGRP